MYKQSVATGSGPLVTGCEHAGSPGSVVEVLVDVEVTVEVDVAVTVVVLPPPSQPGSTGSTRSARFPGGSVAVVYVSQVHPGKKPASLLISSMFDVPSPSESWPSTSIMAWAKSKLDTTALTSCP
jgi:hypothetical protein